MVLILWLSSDVGSAERTGRLLLPLLRAVLPAASPGQIEALHALVRKAAHVVEYAILAALWFRAFAQGGGVGRHAAAWRAIAIAAAWAIVDETFQSTVSSRTGSAVDVGIDVAGALAVAVPAAYGWQMTADRLAGALLWIAAVGGAVLLAINLLVGVESGLLWVTVPAAVLVLAITRRRARPPTR